MTGSNNSSPTDFAFEPPSLSSDFPFEPYKADKTPSYSYTPNQYTNQPFNMPVYGYSSASSFSSTSGSATGSSFSSSDALPAISRDFVRPSPTETRRPATAGGALQSRSPFVGLVGGDGERFQRQNQRSSTAVAEDLNPTTAVETIDEEGVFANPNPFGSPSRIEIKQLPSHPTVGLVDPHFVPPNRRASEPQFGAVPQPSPWSQNYTATINPYPMASVQINQYNMGQPMSAYSHMQQFQQFANSARPQTSDGLPRYAGMSNGISLPSPRTLVSHIDGFPRPQTFYHPRQEEKTLQPSALMPYRDARPESGVSQYAHQQFSADRSYSMDSSKTVRATYNIQPGLKTMNPDDDGELTFVPLSGPAPKKRPRRRFDEIERLYLCGWGGCEKAYGTLNHLNAHVAMQKHGEKRLPSEFKDMRKAWRKRKREQTTAVGNGQHAAGAPSAWPHRHSIDSSSGSDFDRRDSVMSMMSSSDRSIAYAPSYSYAESRPTTSSSIASSADGRPYMSSQYSDHALSSVPVAVRRPSAPGHLPMPQQMPQGFQQADGDYPTPTQANPFPSEGRQSFPFQTLTSPMPMSAGGQQFGAQFAFQR